MNLNRLETSIDRKKELSIIYRLIDKHRPSPMSNVTHVLCIRILWMQLALRKYPDGSHEAPLAWPFSLFSLTEACFEFGHFIWRPLRGCFESARTCSRRPEASLSQNQDRSRIAECGSGVSLLTILQLEACDDLENYGRLRIGRRKSIGGAVAGRRFVSRAIARRGRRSYLQRFHHPAGLHRFHGGRGRFSVAVNQKDYAESAACVFAHGHGYRIGHGYRDRSFWRDWNNSSQLYTRVPS